MSSPISSPSILPIKAIWCGLNIYFAITNIGTLLVWGSSTDIQTIPDELTNINNAKFKPLISIVSYGGLYMALKNDGTVLNWGGLTPLTDYKTIINAKKIYLHYKNEFYRYKKGNYGQ